LIGRLIQALSSHDIAIDDRHTPKLYARFLAGLLIRHRRDGVTTGRLHAMPPPQNPLQDSDTQYGSHMPPTSSQSTFSVPQPQAGTQDGQRHDGRYSHTGFSGNEKTEPVYEPEGTFAFGGPIDFGTSAMSSAYSFDFGSPNSSGTLDEEMLATMQTLKNPAWWSNMMMPGYVSYPALLFLITNAVSRFSWPEPQPQTTVPHAESYMQQLAASNLHNNFGTYHALEVPLH
jgi:hypothetical protein